MITIVTGLPRSGTALMMQILQAAGMELVTDGVRPPDADNPRGYFEFERVKRLAADGAWLAGAERKAVKVVSLLLLELPPDYRYRVIFMTRDMDEILASQREMLLRRRVRETGPDDAEMRRHFEDHLAKVRRHLSEAANVETLYCSYNELLADPPAIVARIAAFIGGDPDRQRMLAAVDPSLYRQRKARS